ncbi:MAG: ABC transporter permease, partial [Blastocatellia bacterium]
MFERCRKPYLWLVRVIGVIVPRRLRADWRQEWEAELRYRETLLAEWDKLNWRNKIDLLRRSLGAFWDALWLQQLRWEDEMIQDLRYGLRTLRGNPGFTVTALLTLALGIGATTTVFTFVDTLLLRPLPVAAPEQLHALGAPGRNLNLNPSYVSYPFYQHLRQASPQFSGLIASTFTVSANANFGANFGEGSAERVRVELVSGNYFTVLGAPPAAGRALTPGD